MNKVKSITRPTNPVTCDHFTKPAVTYGRSQFAFRDADYAQSIRSYKRSLPTCSKLVTYVLTASLIAATIITYLFY